MRKASLLILFGSQLLVILGFWAWNHVHHPLGNLLTGDAAGQCLAYGRLAGLLAAFFILLQILMVGRIGWVERAFGLDSLTRIHHVAGFSLVLFLVAHPVLVTFGHALQAFHRAGLVTLACGVVVLLVNAVTQRERDAEREQFTWGRFQPEPKTAADLKRAWWFDDRLWAALLVVCTLGMCWFFR